MNTILHTKEQGLRVHKLANLGGLVAIAGLENIDSGLLLGAFLELAAQLSHLGLEHVTRLRAQGLQTLGDRKNKKENKPHEGKHHSLQQPLTKSSLTEATLRLDQIKKLIIRLGGRIPALEKDIVPELYRLMR